MSITEDQLKRYETDGYILLPDFFSSAEVDIIKAEIPALFSHDSPKRVLEKGGTTVRSVYGAHLTNSVFYRLTRHPRLVEWARQVLGSEAYVYQLKINAKAAFGGDLWQWHQDYIFWRNEDGMPSPRVMSVAIFLDEVTEFNGPMFLIPGSHKGGLIDVPSRDIEFSGEAGGAVDNYGASREWISNLTADLKYSIGQETVAKLIEHNGLASPKGRSGSALFFDSNVVHASPGNISPYSRLVVIITYNSVENIPVPQAKRRPDFLASQDYTAVVSLSDEDLLLKQS